MPTKTRPRPSLSAELILESALDLIDAEGDDALTFRRLGRQLEADPTAVYRYFRSKDDLLLALADRMIDASLTSVPENAGWRETLHAVAEEGYAAALRHPRLAVLMAARTTQGKAEARAIERVLAALAEAGFAPEEAVSIWRAFSDSVLAWAGLTAAFVSLPPDARAKDLSAWSGTYANLPAEQFPHLHRAAPYLVEVEEKDPFHVAVEIMLDGIAARLTDRPSKGTP